MEMFYSTLETAKNSKLPVRKLPATEKFQFCGNGVYLSSVAMVLL